MKARTASKIVKKWERGEFLMWKRGTFQRASDIVYGKRPFEMEMPDYDDRDYDEYGDDIRQCHYCGGEGWGVVGCDWDSDDPINGPYDGEIEECPCCHGSGKASDCTFW